MFKKLLSVSVIVLCLAVIQFTTSHDDINQMTDPQDQLPPITSIGDEVEDIEGMK